MRLVALPVGPCQEGKRSPRWRGRLDERRKRVRAGRAVRRAYRAPKHIALDCTDPVPDPSLALASTQGSNPGLTRALQVVEEMRRRLGVATK